MSLSPVQAIHVALQNLVHVAERELPSIDRTVAQLAARIQQLEPLVERVKQLEDAITKAAPAADVPPPPPTPAESVTSP